MQTQRAMGRIGSLGSRNEMGARFSRYWRVLALCGLFAPALASRVGAEQVYNAVEHGWYDDTGAHYPWNDNYLVGQESLKQFRNFLVFDLPRATGPIAAAELRLYAATILTPDPSETYAVWDCTNSVAQLTNGTGGLTAYADLGSGVQYGSLDIAAGAGGTYLTVPLNGAGLAALSAHPGGAFVVGGSLPTVVGPADQFVFGWSRNGSVRWVQLVINPKIKMAVPQPPDPTTNGVDVGGYRTGFVMADDFRCTGTGPITGIHVWASFWNDQGPVSPAFRLGLWSDNTNGPGGFSIPSNLLWNQSFPPGSYEQRLFTVVTNGEWWWEPILPQVQDRADTNIWEYVFRIDPAGAMTQQVGKVYWLSVEYLTPAVASGWKTSTNRWNDAAVWSTNGPEGWHRMTYPAPHPWAGQPMDMAFMIQGPDLDSIRGWKYADLNTNGVWNVGEPALSNWWIYLDRNGNDRWDDNPAYASADVPQPIPVVGAVTCTVTVAGLAEPIADVNLLLDITHTFDADLRVSVISPGGTTVGLITSGVGGSGDNFTQTVLDDEAARSISSGSAPFTGRFRPHNPLAAFDGQNPNGTWTAVVSDVVSGDSGTVYVCTLLLGTPSTHEPPMLTDARGAYAFTNVPTGTYTVREEVVTNWIRITPGSGEYAVTVGVSEASSGYDFGNAPNPGRIEGMKYWDQNGNGAWNAGEPGLAGWRIYADLDGDDSWDATTQTLPSTNVPLDIHDLVTVTSAFEVAGFQGAIADLDVRLDIAHTYDDDLTLHLISPSGTRIELFSGVGGDGDNFTGTILDDEATLNIANGTAPFTGRFRPETDLLSSFDGQDANGVWKLEVMDTFVSDQGTLNGWSLIVTTTAAEEPSAVTASDGQYAISNLAAGTYTLREVARTNWSQTGPTPVPPGERVVNLGYTEVSVSNHFGNAPGACRIEGTKFWDQDASGTHDGGEPGLLAWRIYVDANGDGQWTVGTPPSGDYSASDVPKDIPDHPGPVATCQVAVAGTAGAITDLNVTLSIVHTYDSDLDVYLISPAGTRVELFTDVGGTGDNFTDTVLDDEAGTSITSGTAPFTGSYRPEGVLSNFDGQSANGTWLLEVDDDAFSDTGRVINCTLTIAMGPEPSALTDSDGHYSIGGLPTGTWVVAEVAELGWTQTYPPTTTHVVVVQAGEIATGVDFGNAQFDWGDAPPPYATTAAQDGACHLVWYEFAYCLGTKVDSDADGQPHPTALGDDVVASDDEDGVTLLTPLIPGRAALMRVVATPPGYYEWLSAWFDWNGDGDWTDANEAAAIGRRVYGGTSNLVSLAVPASARPGGRVFARFRLDSAGAVGPTGPGNYGEVEDHLFGIDDPSAYATVFSADFEGTGGGFDAEGFTVVNEGQLTNLWHASSIRSASSPWCWYYGKESTTNYDTGTRNAGNLVSPAITLPAVPRLVLLFHYFLRTQGTTLSYDLPTVEVSTDGGASWTVLARKGNPLVDGSGLWQECALDLSAYAGQTVRIRFRFDTMDAASNQYEGWYVDDVEILSRAPGPKWLQEPDCDYGINLPSWGLGGVQGQGPVRYRVADDWTCDGRPIHAIRWWGSYPGYPPPMPPPERPVGFRLTWYLDQPAVGEAYSRPLAPLTNIVVELAPYGETQGRAGYVTEQFYCTVSNKLTAPGFEHEFQYDVRLPSPWVEKAGTIYWLSIEALYNDIPPYRWGWKTSVDHDIIDDAVVWDNPAWGPRPVWSRLSWPQYPWPYLFIEYPVLTNLNNRGPSLNMAFELLSDVSPRRAKKWSEEPDMVYGTDRWSWRYQYQEQMPWGGAVRADDFVSNGRAISDIHWWGSYSNWWFWLSGSATNPVPPPGSYPLRPLGFDLSWHADAGGVPGVELARVFAPIEKCHEVFYGSVNQTWVRPPQDYFEQEYQYYVDLLDPAVSGEPWFEAEGEHYWLNIQAVFTNAFRPSEQMGQHGGWGWKTATHMMVNPSVVCYVGGPGWMMEPMEPPHPYMGQPYDLAFELTTDEPGTNTWGTPVQCVVIRVATNEVTVGSVGTWGAGEQVLQQTTNLMLEAWSNRLVKPAPFPPPWTNLWRKLPPTPKHQEYRVLER